jgi:hypothetical protein
MFEFDRAFIPVNQSHQRTAMFSLAVWPSRQLIKEHGKVVCDDQIDFIFRPNQRQCCAPKSLDFTNLWYRSHRWKPELEHQRACRQPGSGLLFVQFVPTKGLCSATIAFIKTCRTFRHSNGKNCYKAGVTAGQRERPFLPEPDFTQRRPSRW